jgi:hypothetical protein
METLSILLLLVGFALGYLYKYWIDRHYSCPTCKGSGYIEKKIKKTA